MLAQLPDAFGLSERRGHFSFGEARETREERCVRAFNEFAGPQFWVDGGDMVSIDDYRPLIERSVRSARYDHCVDLLARDFLRLSENPAEASRLVWGGARDAGAKDVEQLCSLLRLASDVYGAAFRDEHWRLF